MASETPPATTPPSRMRRVLIIAVPVAGLIGTMTALIVTLDVRASLAAIAVADPRWVAAAVGLTLLLTGLSAVRLSLFARAGGYPRSLRRCWSAAMASTTLNAVLPSRSGDMVKAVFLADRRDEVSSLIGVVLLERVLDVLVLASVAAAAALWMGLYLVALVAGLIGCATVGALVLLRFAHALPIVGDRLEKLGRATRAAVSKPRYLAGGVGLAIGCWSIILAIIACLLEAVDTDVPVGIVAASGPLAILVGLLPVSISGMGTRDAALVLLVGDYAEPERVLAAGLMYTALAYWMVALLGLAALGREALRKVRSAVKSGRGG